MNKTILLPLLLLTFFQTTLVWGAEKKYTIGVENIQYLPYFDGSKEAYSGLAKEIFDLYAHSRGIHFDYIELPPSRLLKYFLEGKVDFKFPDNKNWSTSLKANSKINYSNEIVKYTDGVLVLKTHLNRKLNDLKNLGIVNGFSPIPYLNQIEHKTITLNPNSDVHLLLKQLEMGRIDGAYFNYEVAKAILKAENINTVDINPNLPMDSDIYQLSTIHNKELLEDFNQFLEKNKAQIDELKKKYFIP